MVRVNKSRVAIIKANFVLCLDGDKLLKNQIDKGIYITNGKMQGSDDDKNISIDRNNTYFTDANLTDRGIYAEIRVDGKKVLKHGDKDVGRRSRHLIESESNSTDDTNSSDSVSPAHFCGTMKFAECLTCNDGRNTEGLMRQASYSKFDISSDQRRRKSPSFHDRIEYLDEYESDIGDNEDTKGSQTKDIKEQEVNQAEEDKNQKSRGRVFFIDNQKFQTMSDDTTLTPVTFSSQNQINERSNSFFEKYYARSLNSMKSLADSPSKSVAFKGDEMIVPINSATFKGDEMIVPINTATFKGDEMIVPINTTTFKGDEMIVPINSTTFKGDEMIVPINSARKPNMMKSLADSPCNYSSSKDKPFKGDDMIVPIKYRENRVSFSDDKTPTTVNGHLNQKKFNSRLSNRIKSMDNIYAKKMYQHSKMIRPTINVNLPKQEQYDDVTIEEDIENSVLKRRESTLESINNASLDLSKQNIGDTRQTMKSIIKTGKKANKYHEYDDDSTDDCDLFFTFPDEKTNTKGSLTLVPHGSSSSSSSSSNPQTFVVKSIMCKSSDTSDKESKTSGKYLHVKSKRQLMHIDEKMSFRRNIPMHKLHSLPKRGHRGRKSPKRALFRGAHTRSPKKKEHVAHRQLLQSTPSIVGDEIETLITGIPSPPSQNSSPHRQNKQVLDKKMKPPRLYQRLKKLEPPRFQQGLRKVNSRIEYKKKRRYNPATKRFDYDV